MVAALVMVLANESVAALANESNAALAMELANASIAASAKELVSASGAGNSNRRRQAHYVSLHRYRTRIASSPYYNRQYCRMQ